MTAIFAPVDWGESASELKLPSKADVRLRVLMDRNTEGRLTENERLELESLVEVSESLSLVRAQAFHLLGQRPQ